MVENVVVNSKVKEILKQHNKSMGKDVTSKLTVVVKEAIKKGVERSDAEGRKTLLSRDL